MTLGMLIYSRNTDTKEHKQAQQEQMLEGTIDRKKLTGTMWARLYVTH